MTSDLISALNELRAARDGYEKAQAYYDGDVEERFASEFMRRVFAKSTDDFRVNLACRPVDAVLDRLEIAALTADADDVTEILNTRVWTENQLELEAPQIHQATLMFGDAYGFVWPAEPPDAEDDPEPEPDGEHDDTGVAGVDVFYNSPLTVRILYDPENPRRKRLAIKSWEEGSGDDTRVRVNLYYRDRIEKWISKPKTKAAKDEDFEPFIDESTDENGVMDNPWGEIPFFHFRTAAPYGRPEHINAWGPQDALTKLVVNQMSASDFAAFPQRYGLVEPGAGTDDDTDWGDTDAEDPEDKESSLVSGPGSFWALRNYKAVGEFAPVDVKNFLEPMSVYVRFMAAVTSTPMRWFDPSGDVPSGESLRADDGPLTKKVNARQRWLAATWRDLAGFALKILGIKGVTVTVRWAPPQIISDLEGWQAIQAKQDAGVPVRQTLLEAGYTEAEVDSWGYTEEEPNGPGGLGELLDEMRPPADLLPAGDV